MSVQKRIAAIGMIATLAACATREAAAPPPVVATLPPPAPTMPKGGHPGMAIPVRLADGSYVTPNRALSAAATTWHLRAALNVAALACRGPQEATIVAGYNAMLAANKASLRTAETRLAAEFQASGGKEWRDRYDDAMTRLYNYFSQSFARDAFCGEAIAVLADGAAVPPDRIGDVAQASLARLDRPFTQFFAAYDAWRTGQPMSAPARFAPPVIAVASVAQVASAPPSAAPPSAAPPSAAPPSAAPPSAAPPSATPPRATPPRAAAATRAEPVRAAPVRTAALIQPVRRAAPVPMLAPTPAPVPVPVQPRLEIDLSSL